MVPPAVHPGEPATVAPAATLVLHAPRFDFVASAFFLRGDASFGAFGARAALWALRTWWQQGSRASTERKNAAVAAQG